MEIASRDVVLTTNTGANGTLVSLRNHTKRRITVIRTAKLRSRKPYIERPIQFLYRLELSCDTWQRQKTVHQWSNQPLNVNASEFKSRWNAAAIAKFRIRDAAEANKDEL